MGSSDLEFHDEYQRMKAGPVLVCIARSGKLCVAADAVAVVAIGTGSVTAGILQAIVSTTAIAIVLPVAAVHAVVVGAIGRSGQADVVAVLAEFICR